MSYIYNHIMNEFFTIPLFPKVVSTTILNMNKDEKNTLTNYVKNIKYNIANTNSYNSVNLKILDDKKLSFLKNKIIETFNYFKKETLKCNGNFKITSSWTTKVTPKNIGHSHNHTNSFYSGVFYISSNNSDITFLNTNRPSIEVKYEEYNNLNSNKWNITPKENQIIFFPSEVYHQVEENKSENIRYSLAFNIMPVGQIGIGDSNINLKF